MSNGFDEGGGIDFGGLLGGIEAELAAAISAIIQFLNDLVTALVNAFNLVQGEIVGVFNFTFDGLTSIYKGLKNIMDQVFKVWVLNGLKHLWDLYQKLAAWARKLKAWLDRLHKIQQQFVLQVLRRYINLIQRIRKILVLFRLLHIGIAKKLDAFLGGLEGRLISRVFSVFKKQNEIIRWINLVADPRGLLHPGGQLATLGQIWKAATDAVSVFKPGGFLCVPGQQTGPGTPVLPWVNVRQTLIAESKANNGATAAIRAQFQAQRQMWALDLGDSDKLRA
jgi:hypothetical protein